LIQFILLKVIILMIENNKNNKIIILMIKNNKNNNYLFYFYKIHYLIIC